MKLNSNDSNIKQFINDHKSLILLEKKYQFNEMSFSIVDVIEYSKNNSYLEEFIDEQSLNQREGVFLFKLDDHNLEVKVFNAGFWGTLGIYNNLSNAVKAKLEQMSKEHFLIFKDDVK